MADEVVSTRDLQQPELKQEDSARRPARLAAYAGAGLIILGLIVLYLGYNGAATHPNPPQAQTPFIISGGLLGVGLMALGGIAVLVWVILTIQSQLQAEVKGVRDAIESLAESLARQSFGAPVSKESVTSNGKVYVARGASSYHRSDCRLVARADHVKPLAKEEAGRVGLVPCRICKP
jgi:hypothetical protein